MSLPGRVVDRGCGIDGSGLQPFPESRLAKAFRRIHSGNLITRRARRIGKEHGSAPKPAARQPLNCAKLAFAALPDKIEQRYLRGDSACHENALLGWLKHSDRAKEPGGRIGFALSARMSSDLAKALAKIADSQWKTFDTEADGTSRQWAEVDFVPGEAGKKKDSEPLRHVGLRLLKPQGLLFNDGSDRHHHAVLTNLDWDAVRLLNWHREKAGTVEHVHDEIKNALAGGHMPSQHFAVDATWFKLALLSYNIASAIKGLCLSPEERMARFKKYRLLLVHLAGRMSRFHCKLRLLFHASKEAIARVQKVWAVFALPTQATAFSRGYSQKLFTILVAEKSLRTIFGFCPLVPRGCVARVSNSREATARKKFPSNAR